MSGKLAVTFTGGERIGDSIEVDFLDSVLVGRSHAAGIRLKASDVSGRHLEIIRTADGFAVRNLSRFGSKVDGRKLMDSEEAPLHKGSVVELGAQGRFRIDALPSSGEARAAGDPDQTVATVFGDGNTMATRMMAEAGTVPYGAAAHVSSAIVEESATRDAFSVMDFRAGAPSEPDREPSGALGVADDDAATADDPPAPPDPVLSDPDATAQSSGFVNSTVPQGIAVADDEPADGETQELRTRAGSIEEILERKRQLERNVTKKHWRFGIAVAAVLAALAGIWFATASRKHVSDAEGPFRPDGEPDVADVDVAGADGEPVVFVEYANDPRAEVVFSSDSNQVEVASYIGRDRDIPFRLFFSRSEDRTELAMSLVESFEKWMERESADGGFSFAALGAVRAEVEFWEDAFPGWTPYETQCGVPFVRSEFTRTSGSTLWRGVAYRLRSGFTVLSFRAEVPEAFWRRSAYRLKSVPFVGLHGQFVDSQWDSPGSAGFVSGRGEEELVTAIRHELTASGQRTWVALERSIDTLLAMTWGKGTPNAKSAREFLDDFLARKSGYYNERVLAYESARLNGDEKGMRRIFEDCRDMFSTLRCDRRRYKVNNPEIWKCQEPR